MTSVCYYSVIFIVILVPLCFGHGDLGTLINRIEALEKRDMEQSARVDYLEQQAKISTDISHHLSTSNENLQKQLAETSRKLARQEDITASLQEDLAHQIAEAENSRHKVEILESTVQTMGAKLESINKIIATCKHNLQETIQLVNAEGNTDADSLNLPYDDTSSNDTTSQVRKNNEHLLPSATADPFETNGLNGSPLIPVTRTDVGNLQSHQPKQMKIRYAGSMSSSNSYQRATTNTVAFHAVLSPNWVGHLGANDNIRFDTVLLNEGGGYHNQHGLFIAPKPGFYLFSVTIATDYGKRFYCAFRKNGVSLANIAGEGGIANGINQSSVTVVTKLEAGDEVWNVHVSPDDGSIWGNMYSSFTGVLISEL